jgi:hypothetical protein
VKKVLQSHLLNLVHSTSTDTVSFIQIPPVTQAKAFHLELLDPMMPLSWSRCFLTEKTIVRMALSLLVNPYITSLA